MKSWLCALFIAAATQLHATDVVKVRLVGPKGCANVGETIRVVENGDEQHAFAIARDGTAPCTWRGRSLEPFDPRTTVFSVRLQGARTPVHYADDRSNESIAQLTFLYAPASAFDVGVDALDADKQWMHIGYVRHVWADDRADVEKDEHGELTGSSLHEIGDVNFDAEEVELRLPGMRSAASGLLVNLVLQKTTNAILDREKIVDALHRQDMKGKRRSSPRNSLPQRNGVDDKMMRSSPLDRLELKRK